MAAINKGTENVKKREKYKLFFNIFSAKVKRHQKKKTEENVIDLIILIKDNATFIHLSITPEFSAPLCMLSYLSLFSSSTSVTEKELNPNTFFIVMCKVSVTVI